MPQVYQLNFDATCRDDCLFRHITKLKPSAAKRRGKISASSLTGGLGSKLASIEYRIVDDTGDCHLLNRRETEILWFDWGLSGTDEQVQCATLSVLGRTHAMR